MRALLKTTAMELKLFLREPAAAFFTLLLPLLLLLLNGSSGNDPDPRLGGDGTIDVLLVGYVAYVIATTGLTVLPAVLAQYRERGILRRQRATPVSPAVILGAHVLTNLAVAGVGLVLLVGVGLALFDLNPPAAPLAAGVAVVLGALSFFALSFALVGALPTARSANAVGAALYFPMIFLSGAVFPREVLPAFAQRVGDALPLTYVVAAIREPWTSGAWAPGALAVLVVMGVVAVAVSSRTFRWG